MKPRVRATVYLATSRFEPAIADCKQNLERARAIGSLPLECAALYALGNTLFFSHRLHQMVGVPENLLALAESAESEEARLQGMALMTQGHLALGELAELESNLQQVIERPSVDLRTLLCVLARLRFFQSEYATAEKHLSSKPRPTSIRPRQKRDDGNELKAPPVARAIGFVVRLKKK